MTFAIKSIAILSAFAAVFVYLWLCSVLSVARKG